MSLESDLQTLLGALVSTHAYPDRLPPVPVFPAIVYQQIGGTALWYSERTVPGHKNARVQANVLSKTRLEASTIARLVEGAMCASDLIVEPLGAFTGSYNELLDMYSTRQDFGIWYEDP